MKIYVSGRKESRKPIIIKKIPPAKAVLPQSAQRKEFFSEVSVISVAK